MSPADIMKINRMKLEAAIAVCKAIIARQPTVTLEQSNKMLAEALARKST